MKEMSRSRDRARDYERDRPIVWREKVRKRDRGRRMLKRVIERD